jgi:nucleolar complex protein 3
LTEAEEAEKVRDEVKRMREGEKGLVRTYKAYLKTLETEIRSELWRRPAWNDTDVTEKSPLSTLSIKCYCDLLSSIPHFNFSENIMGVLVGKIGRRSWDEVS